MFTNDITFCPDDRCAYTQCMRNPKNIVYKNIPHSYFIEIPSDCPFQKKLASKERDKNEM